MINKKLFCHPNNFEWLKGHVQEVSNSNPDLFMPFGYDIVVDQFVPEFEYKPTGKLLWKKDKFVDHSIQSNKDISWEEYVDMCVYFGWCEREVIKKRVFHEVNFDTTFLDFKDSSYYLNSFKGMVS